MSDAQVVTLSRFRADVSRALNRRGKQLLESSNLQEQMASLEPLEAYFVVKELGLLDAVPLLMHATPEQLQACFDLDCWVDSNFEAAELDAWLAPFATSGHDELLQIFCSLDPELQILYLADTLYIFDAREEGFPEVDDDVPLKTTPDGHFCLQHRSKDEFEVDPFYLVDLLYRHDLEEAYRLLTAARWEVKSPLVEESLRFRNSRLEDLGFASVESALQLFAKPQSKKPAVMYSTMPTTGKSMLPAVYAAALNDRDDLFVQAVSNISEARTLERIEFELMHLINTAIVAFNESPRDLAHAQSVAERVRNTLSLGIECLLDSARAESSVDLGDLQRAADIVRSWPLAEIFRHGHHATFQLRRDAFAIESDPVFVKWLETYEAENDDYSKDTLDRAFVRGLLSRRGTVLAGFDVLKPTKKRAFRSRDEAAEATLRFDAIVKRVL